MLYKIENKYIIIISPPKCGTCSIHKILDKYALIKKNHIPYCILNKYYLKNLLPNNASIDNVIKIILVREHYNRYLSLFNYIKNKKSESLINDINFEFFVKNIEEIYPKLSFMENDENIEKKYISFFNTNYIKWMTEYGSEDIDKIVIDNILYLDNKFLDNLEKILFNYNIKLNFYQNLIIILN